MTLILAFISAHMGFLWSEARFRIVGSEVSTSNGGSALLTVESFLRDNLADVEARFTGDELSATLEELRRLQRIRSQELFRH